MYAALSLHRSISRIDYNYFRRVLAHRTAFSDNGSLELLDPGLIGSNNVVFLYVQSVFGTPGRGITTYAVQFKVFANQVRLANRVSPTDKFIRKSSFIVVLPDGRISLTDAPFGKVG